jgi:hypothetical protein
MLICLRIRFLLPYTFLVSWVSSIFVISCTISINQRRCGWTHISKTYNDHCIQICMGLFRNMNLL